ncbi:MAG TPA: hypothetical protein VGI46_14470 [Candidatus Acidoferrum sp.]|jgi:hypothetical protein
MSRQTIPASKACALPGWFRVVCLALIILLAHNPYLIAATTAGGLTIAHPPSYRATVAASELQHFSPPGNETALHAVPVRISVGLGLLQADERQPRIYSSQVLSPQPQYWSAGLWFRPPPVS